jgi:hypothetical protein
MVQLFWKMLDSTFYLKKCWCNFFRKCWSSFFEKCWSSLFWKKKL